MIHRTFISKMKQVIPFLLLAGTVFINTSLTEPFIRHGNYTPIFMERSELQKSVFYESESHELINPGKIYSKDQFIFINEKYKGIHIFDNSTPATPKNTGFIVAPGCIDMAIKGNTMYLDNAVDLVAFNLETKKVTQRIQEVFPEPVSPENYSYYGNRPKGLIVVGWDKINQQ